MDSVAACYGVLNTPGIPNDQLLYPSPFAPQLAAAQDTHKLHDMNGIDAYCY
jgi:hypothetical protein